MLQRATVTDVTFSLLFTSSKHSICVFFGFALSCSRRTPFCHACQRRQPCNPSILRQAARWHGTYWHLPVAVWFPRNAREAGGHTHPTNRPNKRKSLALAALLVACVLAACGGRGCPPARHRPRPGRRPRTRRGGAVAGCFVALRRAFLRCLMRGRGEEAAAAVLAGRPFPSRRGCGACEGMDPGLG